MFLSRGEWHSRFPRETLFQDGDLQRSFSNLSLKIFDVLTGLSHFSPCICCIHNIYTSSKYISYILLYFLIKKSHLSSFWPLISTNHWNWSKFGFNLGEFFIFLQVWTWKCYQSTVKVLPTSQLHSKLWIHGWSYWLTVCLSHCLTTQINSIVSMSSHSILSLCCCIPGCIDMRRLIVEK